MLSIYSMPGTYIGAGNTLNERRKKLCPQQAYIDGTLEREIKEA